MELVAVLTRHVGDAGVATSVCGAFYALAASDAHRALLLELGASPLCRQV